MARPPPTYGEAVHMPGRAYENYIPPMANAAAHQAVHHCECPICFEPMHCEQSGVLAQNSGARVCPHFFHHRCGLALLQRGSGNCPLCRATFTSVIAVPKLEDDPPAWFKAVDLNSDGCLTKNEIKYVLLAQMPIDEVILDEELNSYFRRMDKNKDSKISFQELMNPQCGLIPYVRSKAVSHAAAVPDIKSNKEAWYRHYDENNNGSLQKDEVVRGLIQTFKAGHDHEKTQQIEQTLDAVWPIFDFDGSGSIEKSEFLRPGDGLADTIIASL